MAARVVGIAALLALQALAAAGWLEED